MSRRSFVVALILVLILAGCGNSSEPATPEPTPQPTPLPTVTPGGTTVGGLLTAMEAAWSGVASMRTTQWDTDGGASATPPANGSMTVETVILPNARHRVQLVGGIAVDEQIVVDGRIFMRGATVPAMIAPAVDAATWIEVDAAAADAGLPIAGLISYLTTPIDSPLGEVTAETRALEAFPAGMTEVAGRSCQVFTFAPGDAVTYQLSVDMQGLPCSLVVTGGGQSTITTYEFNIPDLAIAAPVVATPPAS